MAHYADRIRQGPSATSLPVKLPARLATAINLKTAKVLAVDIPQSLLLRADEVIQ
ncbi:MAG: hypothetical protein IPP44_17020 [Ideonella sp.]|nr:hypothetical protein [Ideonella sp.]